MAVKEPPMRHVNVCFVLACGLMSAAAVVSGDESRAGHARGEAPAAMVSAYRRPTVAPMPSHNVTSPARELLGRTLFFDPRMSGSNWISCASCHNPGFSWGDGLPTAIGHGMQVLNRRTPTILNLAWAQDGVMWDGRAPSLEDQALGPVTAAGEMNLSEQQLLAKLRAIDGYAPLFERAYPGEGVTAATVAKAIAAFERTVVSEPAPFDRWIEGDANAISEQAKRGFEVFTGAGRCAQCHSGWRFTDDSFHDIGVGGDDIGRGAFLPGIDVMQHAFKTPTLRNVEHRAPYMHNGSVATLEDVIELYDRGGHVRRPSLSPEMKPLALTTAQKQDLLAFLTSLTSRDKAIEVPILPR
jgi:cytochrome c peroxidase